MRKRILESLANKGVLLSMWWSNRIRFSEDTLWKRLEAIALPENALILDLGGYLQSPDHGAIVDCGTLFARHVTTDLSALPRQGGFSVVGPSATMTYAEDSASMRNFLFNLQSLRHRCSAVAVLLPPGSSLDLSPIIATCQLNICDAEDTPSAHELAQQLEKLEEANTVRLWWTHGQPRWDAVSRLRKSQKIWRGVRREDTSKLYSDLLRIGILSLNPPEGWLHSLSRWGWFPALLLCLVPFWPATTLEHSMSALRDLREDKARFSEPAFIEYTFDGSESLQRVARFALGRYTSLIADPKMIETYVRETLTRNNLSLDKWPQAEGWTQPPRNTNIRFFPPDAIRNPKHNVNAPAWRYFTGILNDSIAYLTEFYHTEASEDQRKHDGIDIGGRMGARILAPFSAKAWTLVDDRGGVVIGLVRKDDIMLFMHCDQLLYLDGQDVMEGDPIATVGLTGHTTGPHVHLATGKIAKNGARAIGPVRYDPMDPMEWYRWQSHRQHSASGL